LSAEPQTVDTVTLGQSVVALNRPWKFKVGDSPIDSTTGQPLWAEPNFNDSDWEMVDLTPQEGSIDLIGGQSDYVPGWTTKGHAGYWGYAWYRIRFQVEAPTGKRLALAAPEDVDDVYQVFANGALLGSFGDFSKARPVAYYTRPMMFELPHTPSGPGTNGASNLVLAFRVWMEPSTLLESGADVGGFHSAPLFGQAASISAQYQVHWLQHVREYATNAAESFLFLLLAVVSFSLLLFDRSDRFYIWIGAVFLLTCILQAIIVTSVWTQTIGAIGAIFFVNDLLDPLISTGWVMVWWVWFRLNRPVWIPRLLTTALPVLFVASNLLGEDLFFTFIPHSVSAAFHVVSLFLRLTIFALMLGVVIRGIRTQGMEGWLVLPAVILLGPARFEAVLAALHIRMGFLILGVSIQLGQLSSLLLAAVIALLLLRRLLQAVRRQREIALELKHAEEAKQLARLQSDFVSAVSHEFRSPLTTLRSVTELLTEGRMLDESKRRQSYLYLGRETSRLQRLVDDLLDFGRIESGRKQYRVADHDAFELVRGTVAEFAEQASANGFQVESEFSGKNGHSPATIQVDDEALRRAVRNLLDNAMKYSPDCRTIWVSGSVEGDRVCISVRDKGMGIGADEQQAIFQKFVRGDAAKESGIKGTGIGLAMVRQIVEAMHGEILLTSEMGVGSTFTLVLPLAEN